MNPAVDSFFSKAQKWQDEMALLRAFVLSCGLVEELKWGVPCYTHQQKNIVMIHGFKEYCALLFHKGSLLQDADDLLIQQTENVQSGRQIRFTNNKEIIRLEPILKAYIFEAIEVEKAGVKITYKKPEEFKMPDEFKFKLDEMPALKTAFEALTPGRQRGYLLHFAVAKQSKTRLERIEKYIPTILKGKGITDCTCGLSKKMPSCDGSHKSLKLIG
jgi:uncharacterized protein YdeI (YjbR/CyaY-like superfamily)